MPEVSIIVPIYNVEKYLRRCIDSILNQTFEDFELILIDDGSTDDSASICEEYVIKDKRVKYIYQDNRGVSEARNKGIESCCGKYIQFIDSDDYVDRDFIEILIKKIKKDKSDIAFIGFYNEYDNGEVYNKKVYDNSLMTDKVKKYCLKLYEKDLFGYTWCKIFKSSIVKNNNIKFNKDIYYCEDELFTCEYCKYIKKCL